MNPQTNKTTAEIILLFCGAAFTALVLLAVWFAK